MTIGELLDNLNSVVLTLGEDAKKIPVHVCCGWESLTQSCMPSLPIRLIWFQKTNTTKKYLFWCFNENVVSDFH